MQNKQKERKINLEFVIENFETDKENKTTKCTLVFKPHIKDFAKLYGRPSDKVLEKYPKMCRGLKEAFDKESFVTSGVSKCADNEPFDEEVGIEIARQRARARAEKKYNNWLFAYFRLMMETVDKIDRALAQSDKALSENNRIEELFFI